MVTTFTPADRLTLSMVHCVVPSAVPDPPRSFVQEIDAAPKDAVPAMTNVGTWESQLRSVVGALIWTIGGEGTSTTVVNDHWVPTAVAHPTASTRQ